MPAYSKNQLRDLLQNDHYLVSKGAKKTALDDFGWRDRDIKKAILALRKKDFHKTTENWDNPSIKVDYYRAKGLMGENVYTHFHVEDGELIISSFKELK